MELKAYLLGHYPDGVGFATSYQLRVKAPITIIAKKNDEELHSEPEKDSGFRIGPGEPVRMNVLLFTLTGRQTLSLKFYKNDTLCAEATLQSEFFWIHVRYQKNIHIYDVDEELAGIYPPIVD